MLSTVFLFRPPIGYNEEKKGCECWRPDIKSCLAQEQDKLLNFELDIDDIADSLMEVMRICRLKQWEVKRIKQAIKRSFIHYEEIRYRIDRVPKKRFAKENFLHDVAVEGGMKRLDGQLAYGIVKRAFHAYYHGSGEGGRRLESLAQQMRHRPECFWLHAAQRTAEIFAAYAGLMYSEQQQYLECIECVYKSLYKVLQSRLINEVHHSSDCVCKQEAENQKNSVWDAISGTTLLSGTTAITTELFFNKQSLNLSKATSGISIKMEYMMVSMDRTRAPSESLLSVTKHKPKPKALIIQSEVTLQSAASKTTKKKKNRRNIKCTCPSMQCIKERRWPVITAECSQGPYVCRWVPYEEEEDFPKHHVPCPPMEDICPPCEHGETPCDDECTCTCEFCQCSPAESVEEEHAEKLSAGGLEDRDTDYCWLAPFRDWPRVEKPADLEDVSAEEEELFDEEGNFKCRCTCEYKKRAFPHLFTYLMPFKSEEQIPQSIVEEEPPKKPKPKQLPCGISLATYRCWTEPQVESEDSVERELPHFTVLGNAQLTSKTKVPPPGMTIDVTVKTQHYPSPKKNQGKSVSSPRNSITVKKSTIAALETNLKTMETRKSSQPSAKMPNAQPKATPVPTPVPGPVAAPVRAPAPAPLPAPAPAPTQKRESADKLTKEDIVEMLGLK